MVEDLSNNSSCKLSEASNDYYNSMYRPHAVTSTPAAAPTFRFGNYKTNLDVSKPSPSGVKKVNHDVIMLGRDALDRELSCLYQVSNTGQASLWLDILMVSDID